MSSYSVSLLPLGFSIKLSSVLKSWQVYRQKCLSSSPLAVVALTSLQQGVTSILLFPKPVPWATYKKQFCVWFQDMGHGGLRDTGLPRSPVHGKRDVRLMVCNALNIPNSSFRASLWVQRTHHHHPHPQTASEQWLILVCHLILIKKNQLFLSTFPMETFSCRKQTQIRFLTKSHYFPW